MIRNNTASVTIGLCAAFLTLGLAGCAGSPEATPVAAPAASTPPPATPAEPARPVAVDSGALQPDYPQRYTVQRGDTLWDIAKHFLKDPWLWPEVWYANPDIKNPHLIYPGDVIVLRFEGGKPVLSLERQAPKGLPTVKLSPQIREETIEQAVPTIPLSAIGPFLSGTQMMSEDEFEAAPYIVSSYEEHLMTGAGNRIYARGLKRDDIGAWTVVRKGDAYRDPKDPDHVLGYEATYVGEARLVKGGNPATLQLVSSRQEALVGDRLFPYQEKTPPTHFTPRAPDQQVDGRIIDVLNGVSQIGQYQTVVLNLGEKQGLEPGHVLAVSQTGGTVRDPVAGGERVRLPEERAGVVMVYRTFPEVSYALVMEAARSIHVSDRVSNP